MERFVYSRRQQHLPEMLQGNRIKGRLKLPLIWKKCLKVCRDQGPEPCHPAGRSIYVWRASVYLGRVEFHYTEHSIMPWEFPWRAIKISSDKEIKRVFLTLQDSKSCILHALHVNTTKWATTDLSKILAKVNFPLERKIKTWKKIETHCSDVIVCAKTVYL